MSLISTYGPMSEQTLLILQGTRTYDIRHTAHDLETKHESQYVNVTIHC